jgi:transaldolase
MSPVFITQTMIFFERFPGVITRNRHQHIGGLMVQQFNHLAAGLIARVILGFAQRLFHNFLPFLLGNYRDMLVSARWQRAFSAGARPQRLLWASTGTKDPNASDDLYVKALAAPLTVNTMPEATLKALADHGELGSIMAADGGNCEAVIEKFSRAGVHVDVLADQLQKDGAKSFVKSWNDLMTVISSKSSALKQAA